MRLRISAVVNSSLRVIGKKQYNEILIRTSRKYIHPNLSPLRIS